MREGGLGEAALPLLELCGNCLAAAVFLAGIGATALGGEFAAGVLPALAVVVPVEAELGKLAADFLGRRLGEGDPNPLADDLGEVELFGEPLPEEVQDLVGGEGAVLLALLEVDVRKNPVSPVES